MTTPAQRRYLRATAAQARPPNGAEPPTGEQVDAVIRGVFHRAALRRFVNRLPQRRTR